MSRPFTTCILFVMTGCATTPQNRDHYRVASTKIASNSTVAFVANGAGDSRSASLNLSMVVAETSARLHVETVFWSRGYQRVFADQVDQDNHRTQGRKLAGELVAYRCAHPDRRICLVGQSAGSAVVLGAAELLPPGIIDRIILLSPSVCTNYDLRPALATAREGIDCFYSNDDRFVLGLGMRIVGTTDGDCRVAAGRVGFTAIVRDTTDAALYGKLRQYSWGPSVAWTGHNGGHFGNIEPQFLRAYVLPLLGG